MYRLKQKFLQFLALATAALAAPHASHAATVFVAGPLTGSNVWTANNTYILTNYVYVLSNAVLRIEPGTVIKGRNGAAPNFGSLFICQGAKIFAEGLPNKPIIFTAEVDDLDDPNDLGPTDRGLWGGLTIFGKARINAAVDAAGDAANPRYEVYEGLTDTVLGGQHVHRYGGNDDDDSSGCLRYVSLRHGGQKLSPDKEINGLSLGAVGRGTLIEYVEVFSFADDGFEFFGGSVNTRYLVSAFNDDDQFDTDMGYSGKNQFWFALMAADKRDQGAELNGEPNERNPGGRVPVSNFEVYNATLIGAGSGGVGAANNHAFTVRRHSQTRWFNSVFTDFHGQPFNGGGPLLSATPVFQDNLWFGFTTPNFTNVLFTTAANRNQTNVNPQLGGISRAGGTLALDPRPAPGSPAFANYRPTPADGFYSEARYQGAFGEGNWLLDWTLLSQGCYVTASGAQMAKSMPDVKPTVTTADGGANATVTWPTSSGRQYLLQSTTDMVTWTDESGWLNGTAGNLSLSRPVPGVKKMFRVLVR